MTQMLVPVGRSAFQKIADDFHTDAFAGSPASQKAVYSANMGAAAIDRETLLQISKITLIIPPGTRVTIHAPDLKDFPPEGISFENCETDNQPRVVRLKVKTPDFPTLGGSTDLDGMSEAADDSSSSGCESSTQCQPQPTIQVLNAQKDHLDKPRPILNKSLAAFVHTSTQSDLHQTVFGISAASKPKKNATPNEAHLLYDNPNFKRNYADQANDWGLLKKLIKNE